MSATRWRIAMFISGLPAVSGRGRIVGWEQRAQRLLVADRLEGVTLSDVARAGDRRSGVDRLKEPFEIGERRQRIVGALAYSPGAAEPPPSRHVGDRVRLADNVRSAF